MVGLLDAATNFPARWSQSGMPDAPRTLALSTLKTHAVTSVTPKDVRDDPPRQTLRNDLLRSGMVPGSEGDRLFVAAHGGVNVWDDPGNSHSSNDEIFRATNVRRSGRISRTPDTFTGNLTEDDRRLAEAVTALADACGVNRLAALDSLRRVAAEERMTLEEALREIIDEVSERYAGQGISLAEGLRLSAEDGVDAFLREHHARLTAKVKAQLSEASNNIRAAVKTKTRDSNSESHPTGSVKAASGPSTAFGGSKPNNAFVPDEKRKKTDGISTNPVTRDRVHATEEFLAATERAREESVKRACDIISRGARA